MPQDNFITEMGRSFISWPSLGKLSNNPDLMEKMNFQKLLICVCSSLVEKISVTNINGNNQSFKYSSLRRFFFKRKGQ